MNCIKDYVKKAEAPAMPSGLSATITSLDEMWRRIRTRPKNGSSKPGTTIFPGLLIRRLLS